MIRFESSALAIDRCSWRPTADGLAIRMWDGEFPQRGASLWIDLDSLRSILRACELAYETGQETGYGLKAGCQFEQAPEGGES